MNYNKIQNYKHMKNTIRNISYINALLYSLCLLGLFIISLPVYSLNMSKTGFSFGQKQNYITKLPTSTSIEYMFIDTLCGDTITDYDNNSYSTVQIGNQCWMGENLKATHYASGLAIPNIISNKTWEALLYSNIAYCYYNNSTADANTYGALYTWAAAMGNNKMCSNTDSCVAQGACPTGWHLPSKAEWTELINYLGGESVAGGKLKEIGNTHWNSPNIGATNSSGFTALPGGARDFKGPSYWRGYVGTWWSSSEEDVSHAWYFRMYNLNEMVYNNDMGKENGFSIRCVKGAALASVSTDSISDITQTSATCISNVTIDGGSSVIARGVCWNTAGNPTIEDSITTDGSGTGIFLSNLTGLSPNTLYYVRAYVTNDVGTAYGNEKSFNEACSAPITDYDGNTYKIVQIGNQCWMAENLRTTHFASGISIPYRASNSLWNSLGDNNTSAAYCYYNNDTANANTYGALYSWAAAMGDNAVSSNTNPSGVQGVCPNGWHLPSSLEWNVLYNYFNSSYDAGAKLKEAGNTHWDLPNVDATNSTDFTALPGGQRDEKGNFKNIGSRGYWWLSTEKRIYSNQAINSNSDSFASCMNLCNYSSGLNAYCFYKSYGFSVRCVRD